MNEKISTDFPFESKYIEVKDSQMHYIETGEGDLFNCVLTCIGVANDNVAVSIPWDPYYAGEWGYQKGLHGAEL